ncbi:hypothetical protein [Rhodococcus globerulus]|uniref:hypothetical protein n=1 Tax=Rhodococcus globerulus TaxID=33008 RepID=UPI00294B1F5B|nr:hypothetical protein [Rhodococcus globerulus]
MSVRNLLAIDAPEEIYPVTNAFQQQIIEILSEFPETGGDSPIAGAVGLALLNLETKTVELEAKLLDSNAERLNLQARLADLETRILMAGVKLPAPE